MNDELFFRCPGLDTLTTPREFVGEEGLNQLFWFEVVLGVRQAGMFDLLVATCRASIGKPAAFGVKFGDGRRFLRHGIVTQAELVHTGEVVVVIRPRLSRLAHRSECRIYHDQTTSQVAEAVLSSAGFAPAQYTFAARGGSWPVCVQYRETALNFFHRLLEHDGLFFTHTHTEADHTLLVGDDVSCCPEVPPLVVGPRLVAQRPVEAWRARFNAAPSAYTLSDVNFPIPHQPLGVTAGTNDPSRLIDFPGEFHTRERGGELASIRLEEQQAMREVYVGRSWAEDLAPGVRFSLPAGTSGAGWYNVIAVSHRAVDAGREGCYSNEFSCIPKAVRYRPVRTTARPHIDSTQWAIVVGADEKAVGAERSVTHTDPNYLGCVRVRFLWDQEGAEPKPGQCAWVPVTTVWGGNGFGLTYTPRVGEFVLVAFAEGLPERPVVIGSRWTVANRVTFPGPTATAFGLKTRPAPDGDASQGHFVHMEDKQGSERFSVGAERLMTIEVGGELYARVGKDWKQVVDGAQAQSIGGELSVSVGRDVQLKSGGRCVIQSTGGVHLSAGERLVLSAAAGLSLDVGGNFITIDSTGVAVNGTLVRLNCDGPAPDPAAKVVLPSLKPPTPLA